jgi:hypothetical protein
VAEAPPVSEGRVPWHHVGNRIMGNPFSTFGDEWCPRCRMVVDTDTEAAHGSGVYRFRRWCLRCGRVLKYGACRAPIISDRPLPAAVLTMVTTPGADRR